MSEKQARETGLRGVVAGQSRICTVSGSGDGLRYYGYDIRELAASCRFEEVAYLLLHGELPNASQLGEFEKRMRDCRTLPGELLEVLERIPETAHPMDVLRTGTSMLGNLESESEFADPIQAAIRVMATLPAMVTYWYRFSHQGERIDVHAAASSDLSHAACFLELLNGTRPPGLHEQVMNASLILYAEHEFNASTFTARVCASTLSDLFSCITGAIGSLRGDLHGGANEKAMDMIAQWQTADEAESAILEMLARREKIMGFGHAVYRSSDPRNAIIKTWSQQLSEAVGDLVLYPVSVRCEEVMRREKNLFCNADFFHASAYHFMGIPTKLFTPIFVFARSAGWCAHVFEQRANNRIIRPTCEYTGPSDREFVRLADRT